MPTQKRSSIRGISQFVAGECTLKLKELTEVEGGYRWKTFLIEWRHDGQRFRRKFKERRDADSFIYRKQVELANDAGARHRVTTRLSQDQINEAEDAFHRLGERYDLRQAVDLFLDRFCEPDFQIRFDEAIPRFLDGKESEGVRSRTLVQLKSTMTRFGHFTENAPVHEIGVAEVEEFLRSLRGRDGVSPASQKTWNNSRAELSSFFSWCADPRRRWISENPVKQVVKFRKIDRDLPKILSVEKAAELMAHVERFKKGRLTRYFTLALFAGLRSGPGGEIHKLAASPERDQLIDLERGVIQITPAISKTGQKRQIAIRPNLRSWLEFSNPVILPSNYDRDLKDLRRAFGLSHDILRHSFISYHVAAFRSIGDAAIEAGNSEAVTKRHYLNLATQAEGKAFWEISPS